ncbi:polyprenyl synthetase family protein [Coxiella endosymbiont of Amblyomma nuttalli]|uniref:polyprenyl synthetase family protein n=1 Tax=Coxiella endosymbiont of Amblyomma nuttalli TaxID=2749996 RepID=UPI001BA92DDC|nr:polyprenyl synthetase family protein [Coxiella endosymbiont of Amblyomma nuttalli]QTS84046.1 Farnesyl diphosphate synthase [Coxiella endosymbiont of Amblyomma nuttalli]
MNFIENYQARINQNLRGFLPDHTREPCRLHEAMHYAVTSGGKRIRPLLTYATGLCFTGDPVKMDNSAVAVELMHCYSLVHDDLPCMDNDDFRRGQPSCHKAFNEGTAILVGDALQCLAFEILTRENNPRLIAILARAGGSCGMIGGQQLDLEAKNKTISEKQIKTIHRLKTGSLFRAAVELGALSVGYEEEAILSYLRELGTLIGLIFQRKDDIEDQAIGEIRVQATVSKNLTHLFKQTESLLGKIEGNTRFFNLIIDFLKPTYTGHLT